MLTKGTGRVSRAEGVSSQWRHIHITLSFCSDNHSNHGDRRGELEGEFFSEKKKLKQ